MCSVLPPIFPDQNVSVYENATFDEAVGGPLTVYPPSADVAVIFRIVDGNTTLFKIGVCNGQLRINDPLLSYHAQSSYTLIVQGQSNGLDTSATNATIMVSVLKVPHPPVFNDTACMFTVNEAEPLGTLLIGTDIYAADVDGSNITYSIDPVSAGAVYVKVDNITGEVSTTAVLDYSITTQVRWHHQ